MGAGPDMAEEAEASGSENPGEIFLPPARAIGASGLVGVELVDDGGGITVIFGGRHNAELTVSGLEDDNADHQGGGEIPGAKVSGFEGLRHCFGSYLEAGTIPARQAPEMFGRWPQSPRRRSSSGRTLA
jgi:hypothetical protein